MGYLTKRGLIRGVFVAEVVLFGYFFYWSERGMQEVLVLKRKYDNLNQSVLHLEQENDQLAKQIDLWKNDTFLKEKIARENLHMAHPSDIVVFLD